MAAHIIAQEKYLWKGTKIPPDPCMYCCSSTKSTKCNVLIEGNEIVPECRTYSIPRSVKGWLRVTIKHPTSNMPFQCPTCKEFIPLYNMLTHAEEMHSITKDEWEKFPEIKKELEPCMITEDEKTKILLAAKLKMNPPVRT